jgi:putative hydrolase of the HAD superfamily
MATLIFDADDTLWENNVVFEAVIADFIDWLAHPSLDAAGVRRALGDIERANVAAHGYGTRVFIRSLHDAVVALGGREIREDDRAAIARLVARLEWEELELLPGVPETLRALARRHDLLLLTKGDDAEQRLKIEVSGLAELFRATEVVREKNVATYRTLIDTYNVDPADGWMIGNSPKSDVLPALEAGLRAVFIPHPHTWHLEHAEVPAGDARVLTLERLPDLLAHF